MVDAHVDEIPLTLTEDSKQRRSTVALGIAFLKTQNESWRFHNRNPKEGICSCRWDPAYFDWGHWTEPVCYRLGQCFF
ncbi:hypothetical protein CDAR_252151 [Caerostris darwini]|uniref:Uncharacterized protein n=1 Tax=Caerostris darwini TaxID=1538125 RepID=A0AAV4QCY0_9ARAC|nr:hypothetical protein CDAR_252151 [Caerostris darwini]